MFYNIVSDSSRAHFYGCARLGTGEKFPLKSSYASWRGEGRIQGGIALSGP